ncbi:nucleoporin subcomplex protein binding to Pom34-domain-containing protein [Limtongia smithiae]|uniref:nucleoporin subcomplex protein binding to Pom34-domain-containing protein n=1 Tax=Limtongia smithiae TaxID=1125753 RepID=UPI0034CFB3F6
MDYTPTARRGASSQQEDGTRKMRRSARAAESASASRQTSLLETPKKMSLSLLIDSNQSSTGADSPDAQKSTLTSGDDDHNVDLSIMHVEEAEQKFFLLQKKFPVSYVPFLRALRATQCDAYEILSNMTTYMQNLPRGFSDYDVSTDDTQVIYLLSSMCIYAPREDGEGGIYIPKGCHGTLITNQVNAFCVLWRYSYNGWAYIGRVLEHASKVLPTSEIVEETLLLIAETMQNADQDDALRLLEALSENLYTPDYIIEVVGVILQEALRRRHILVSVAAMNFFSALVPFLPHKVWEFVVSSQLLECNGAAGLSADLLSAVEIITGDYRFTLSFINLAHMLLRDSVIGKFTTMTDPKVRESVMLQTTRHLINVFESFPYWKYDNIYFRLNIGISIADFFSGLLTAVYGIDEASNGTNKINGVLFPASQFVLERFLVSEDRRLRCLQTIIISIEGSSSDLKVLNGDTDLYNRGCEWIEFALRFAEELIKMRSLLDRLPTQLERRLFRLLPTLAHLFTHQPVLQLRITRLLDALVAAPWTKEQQPSLLAYLGTESSLELVNSFIKTIKMTVESQSDAELEPLLQTQVDIAKFASLVFQCANQKGLSVLLLTGKELNHDDSGTCGTKSEAAATSFLELLEKKIESFEELPIELAIQILECISLARNTMAAVMVEGRENKAFMKKIFEIFDQVSIGTVTGMESSNTIVRFCNQALLSSCVVQLCAMYLHKARHGSLEAKEIISHFISGSNKNIVKLTETAFRIHGYRASLHGNLHRNFDKKWPQAKLVRFQKSSIASRKYGQAYLYDLTVMSIIFGMHKIWMNGYRTEIIAANLNLSLIDAQSHLYHAWWLLVVALLEHSDGNQPLQADLEKVARQCLQINIEEGIMAPLFIPIVNNRSQLAFTIIHKLSLSSTATTTTAAAAPPLAASISIGKKWQSMSLLAVDYRAILKLAYRFIGSADMNFQQALSERKVEMYRPLLRILIIATRALKGVGSSTVSSRRSSQDDEELQQIITGILEHIVTRSFMLLGPDALDAFREQQLGAAAAVTAGDGKQKHLTDVGEDMMLVTCLLRNCLNVDNVTR